MVDIMISIGDRKFQVACEEGQEQELQEAVGFLDHEAKTILDGSPEANERQILLLSGLMVAHRVRELENGLVQYAAKIQSLDSELSLAKRREYELESPTQELQVTLSAVEEKNKALSAERDQALKLVAEHQASDQDNATKITELTAELDEERTRNQALSENQPVTNEAVTQDNSQQELEEKNRMQQDMIRRLRKRVANRDARINELELQEEGGTQTATPQDPNAAINDVLSEVVSGLEKLSKK